jgi:hypothetical protein
MKFSEGGFAERSSLIAFDFPFPQSKPLERTPSVFIKAIGEEDSREEESRARRGN